MRVQSLQRVLVLLWFLRAWPAFGSSVDAVTLVGLEGFRIEIGSVSKAARELGMDEGRLRALTSERLRRATLAVGDFPAILLVSLRTVEHPTRVLAYCLEVEVRQLVHLTRTSQMQLFAPTWVQGKLSMVPRASLVVSVEHALAELLDELAGDYRLVNGGPVKRNE